jgi:thiol-disulfide isomerase/thioredoxin
MIEYSNLDNLNLLVQNNECVFVNLLADGCPACEEFKKIIPEIKESTRANIINIKFSEENEAFLKNNVLSLGEDNLKFPSTFIFFQGKMVPKSLLLNKQEYLFLIKEFKQ